MQVFKYNEALQKALQCDTKPEPWLHIAVKHASGRNADEPGTYDYYSWCIYVWDTRQVQFTCKVNDLPVGYARVKTTLEPYTLLNY